MAQLAIKGHPTRGKEVIQLLEMLGGENRYDAKGNCNNVLYVLCDNEIQYLKYEDAKTSIITIYTLEEFEKKFPYKVGDKVTLDKSPCIITEMYWDYDDVIYYVNSDDFSKGVYSTDKDLQPYKEETIEGVYAYNEINCYHQDFGNKVRIRLGNDFEIKVEDNITYIVKKQPQYPKTYEECCRIIDYHLTGATIIGYEKPLLENLQQLLICRDAYWKIAGKQLGLDKHWKPEWNNGHVEKYYIYLKQNEIEKSSCFFESHFLAFPTSKMRDTFYENFKDLIEQCKEVL